MTRDLAILIFDDVEVPVENLIGPEHDGWRVANTTLANERGGLDNITVIVARLEGEALRAAHPGDTPGHQVYPLIDTDTATEPVPVRNGT